MKLVELDMADISLVELRDDGHIGKLTPHCKIHGAMNKISPFGYWRCITTSYEIGITYLDQEDKKQTKKISGNKCRAGCIEVTSKNPLPLQNLLIIQPSTQVTKKRGCQEVQLSILLRGEGHSQIQN